MAEALVTVETVHETFGDLFDGERQLKRRVKDLEAQGRKREQTDEDLLAGAIALSDDVDGHDVAIKTLVERVGVLEYGLWAQALKVQEIEQMLRMEHGLRVETTEKIAAIMSAA